MAGAAEEVVRLLDVSDDVGARLEVSRNGVPVAEVREAVQQGRFALFRCGDAHAVISGLAGDRVCIEAVEGHGGLCLTQRIVAEVRRMGYTCEAWVLSESRARLAARAGFRKTGATRDCGNGTHQIHLELLP